MARRLPCRTGSALSSRRVPSYVATATVAQCRIVVSWNFKHIVHFQKILLYNAVNKAQGYSDLAIHSPQEVIEHEEDFRLR
jgi:hypothetical protein